MRNHWLRNAWKLKIERIEPELSGDSFVYRDIKISKGPYSTTFSSCCMQDVRDCHGLTAEGELTAVISQELSNTYKTVETETKWGVRTSWERSFHKNIEITNDEKRRMAFIFHCMRHNKPYEHLLD